MDQRVGQALEGQITYAYGSVIARILLIVTL